MIDLHSHIFYGFDDGAQSLEESIEMARIAAADGIEKIVGTPHLFRGDFKGVEIGAIRERRAELEHHLKREKIDIEVYAGAEVHISHNLIDEIRRHREILTVNNSSYMLLEFPSNHIFPGVKDLFFQIESEEIEPIIAHPERNSVFRKNPVLLYELIEMGALVQANRGSFQGRFGSSIRDAAFQFLDWNFIHFIGSDAHNVRSMSPQLADTFRMIAERIGKERAYALVWDNPQAVLSNDVIPYRTDPVYPVREEKSFKIKLPRIIRKK